MSGFLVTSSFATTVLIPHQEFQAGGKASGRALAYLAHQYLGNGFGTVYDLSTVCIGRVASGRFVRAGVVITGWASDRQGELVEGDCQPPLHRFLDGQLIVAAANVLDEGVSGDHDPGAVLLPEPAHRS